MTNSNKIQFLHLNQDNIYNVATYLDANTTRNLAATCKLMYELLYSYTSIVKKAKLTPLIKSFCFHKFIPIAHLTDAFTLTSHLAETSKSSYDLFHFTQNRINDLITLEELFHQQSTTKPPPITTSTLIHETCNDLLNLINQKIPHVDPKLQEILKELKDRLFQRTRFYYLDFTRKQSIYIAKLNMYFHTYIRNMLKEITFECEK